MKNLIYFCLIINDDEKKSRFSKHFTMLKWLFKYIVIVCIYYATFSNRFIMANMKRAESKQRIMNTPQTTHKGRSPQR